jgi:hypothetical protein
LSFCGWLISLSIVPQHSSGFFFFSDFSFLLIDCRFCSSQSHWPRKLQNLNPVHAGPYSSDTIWVIILSPIACGLPPAATVTLAGRDRLTSWAVLFPGEGLAENHDSKKLLVAKKTGCLLPCVVVSRCLLPSYHGIVWLLIM